MTQDNFALELADMIIEMMPETDKQVYRESYLKAQEIIDKHGIIGLTAISRINRNYHPVTGEKLEGMEPKWVNNQTNNEASENSFYVEGEKVVQ